MKYAFAHRGGRAHGPDNTIPTFARALAEGATGLETDAWLSSDGIVVLDHDGVHRAGTPDEQPITEIARAELADHIPTLAELYDACGTDFDLAIDIKGSVDPDGGGVGQAIRDVAGAVGAVDRLWLFTPSTTRPGDVSPARGGVTVRAEELRDRVRRKLLLESLRNEGIAAVNARWAFWTRSAVAEVHALGMLAFAWDVQWSVALWRCKRLGIDGIFSDHMRVLHAARR